MCNKHIKELLQRLSPVISGAGASHELEVNHPHPRLYLTYNGVRKFTPLAKTPHRERDTFMLKMRDVKQLLREMGATV